MPSEIALRWANNGEGRLASRSSSTVPVYLWISVKSSAGCVVGFLAFVATRRYVRSASKACRTALAYGIGVSIASCEVSERLYLLFHEASNLLAGGDETLDVLLDDLVEFLYGSG